MLWFMAISCGMNNVAVAWMRAAATLAVVQLHCLRPFFKTHLFDAAEEMARCALDFAAPSFFFVAGFLLPLDPRHGLRRRLFRVTAPYTVVTVARWSVARALASLRRTWWLDLILQLRLTNFEEKWPDSCLLHAKLEQLAPRFKSLEPPPSATQLATELGTGSGFGHFYFVVVLVQLHLCAAAAAVVAELAGWWEPSVATPPSTARLVAASDVRDARRVRRLVAAAAVLQLLRGQLFELATRSADGANLVMRLPFPWWGFFAAGFAARHGVVERDDEARSKSASYGRRAATTAVLSLGLALVLVAKRAPRALVLAAKDVYFVALPAAVSLLGAARPPPDDDDHHPASPTRMARLARRVREVVNEYSYTIYLYQGFLLDAPGLPRAVLPRALAIFALSLVGAQLARAALHPSAAVYLGIAPAPNAPPSDPRR